MQVWLRAPVADMVRLREKGKLRLKIFEFIRKYEKSLRLWRMKLPSYKRSSEAVSSIANVEPSSTEPSTAKFFKILEYTQLTVRQISSGSSQNWSIGTDFTHVPRVCRQ